MWKWKRNLLWNKRNYEFGDITGLIDTTVAPPEIYDYSNGCEICYEVIGEVGSRIIMIANKCPGCEAVKTTGKFHLDLDERLFPYIDNKDKGRINITMRMVPCHVNGNVIFILLNLMIISNYKMDCNLYK